MGFSQDPPKANTLRRQSHEKKTRPQHVLRYRRIQATDVQLVRNPNKPHIEYMCQEKTEELSTIHTRCLCGITWVDKIVRRAFQKHRNISIRSGVGVSREI